MKTTFTKKILPSIIAIVVIGIIAVASANDRTAPLVLPENIDQPIDIGNNILTSIKGVDAGGKVNGGLAILDPFIANENANIKGVVNVLNSVLGPDVAHPDVYVGDTSHKVKILATGDVRAGAYLRAWNLENTSLKRVCANAKGTLILCSKEALDVCTNIPGIQPSFQKPPFDKKMTGTKDTTADIYDPGVCTGPAETPIPNDECFNIPGLQTLAYISSAHLIQTTTSTGLKICGRNSFYGKPLYLGKEKAYGYHDYGGLIGADDFKMYVPPPFGGVDVRFYHAGMRLNFFAATTQPLTFDWNYCVRTYYKDKGDYGGPDKWQCPTPTDGAGTYGEALPKYDPNADISYYKNGQKIPRERYNETLPVGSTGFIFHSFANHYSTPIDWGVGLDRGSIDAHYSYGVTAKMGTDVRLTDCMIFIHVPKNGDPEGYLNSDSLLIEPDSECKLTLLKD